MRRVQRLEPEIERITVERLDAMAAGERPAELVRAFALPIPSLVICELLGVPYTERRGFQCDTATILDLDATPEQRAEAVADFGAYLRELVARKRVESGDDLLSGLMSDGELTDAELAGIGMLLLIAGHETTANMLALGAFALLTAPEQRAAVRDAPSAAGAVEELLRYLSILHGAVTRTARVDLEIGGAPIGAGDTVAVSLPAANRDPERFDAPEILDVGRSAAGHLAFGHGIHQCLGQHLARSEMVIAYPALLRRFPGLRLAVPAGEIPMRAQMMVYGVHRLPVTW